MCIRDRSTVTMALQLEHDLERVHEDRARLQLVATSSAQEVELLMNELAIERRDREAEATESAEVVDALRAQLLTARSQLQERETAHKLEVQRLTISVQELERALESGEAFATATSKAKNLELLRQKHQAETATEAMTEAKARMFEQAGALKKAESTIGEREIQIAHHYNMLQTSEHFRDVEVSRLRQMVEQERWKKQDRCAELQDEKLMVMAEMHRKLGLSLNALLKEQSKKVETSTVLGIVCSKSRDILNQKNQLSDSYNTLEAQKEEQGRRYHDMQAQKHSMHTELNNAKSALDSQGEQLEDALQMVGNLQREIADFHSYCNSKSLDFRAELQNL
eukprot:TRINITY_DN48968_c0_g1_i1.p1 TRINITY_DN48968_c0_g1~~TRINITY_DN48968_c0_g1_i1.p1  ORF type:complete len:338 (+),score=121.68 TRINITY_DN48968_c0_g1_i1:146-1159(+)